jgi:hypothetical protein
MKILKLYDVQSWDGGSLHNHYFWLDNIESAKEYTKNNKMDTFYEKTFVVYSSLEDRYFNSQKNLIASAKSKMTEAEWHAVMESK